MPTPKRALFPALLVVGMTMFLAGCAGPNLFDYLRGFPYNGICLTIVVILDVIALVEVFGSVRSTGNKLLWALFIIFFPIIGCIGYYLASRD